MTHLITIHQDGKPHLVEVPDKPEYCEDYSETYCPSMDDNGPANECYCDVVKKKEYEQAVASAIADESNHIQFMDELAVKMYCADIYRQELDKSLFYTGANFDIPIGKTFDLPEGYDLIFENVPFTPKNKELFGVKKMAVFTPIKGYWLMERTGTNKTLWKNGILLTREPNQYFSGEGQIWKESEPKKEPVITEKEKAHFWYHLGAASGIVAAIGGKDTDFEKAWAESTKE